MRSNTPPSWIIHPFLRLTPPFLIGMVTGEQRWAGNTLAWGAAMASILLLLTWSLLKPARRWAHKYLTGLAMYLLLASTGLTCSWLHREPGNDQHKAIAPAAACMVAELHDVAPIAEGRYRARASPVSRSSSTAGNVPSDVLLYFDPVGMAVPPASGDLVAIRATWKPIRNRGNPGEPDIAAMYASRGLLWQAQVKARDMTLLDRRGPPFWEGRFLASRTWIEGVLHRYLPDSASADLASTLLTGHRASMDPELLQAYANTGVVHVIAISGLHLGMIHGLLLWMLTPLFRRLGWSRTGALVILPWLWIYACFTGASASVIRSAAMFTGIGIANAMGRRQFLLNGLGSSAMVLLAIRPDWISDIGCQLSYAALLSIALFQTTFRKLIEVSNPVGAGIRDLVTVTLAAQVLTAPLVAWHFHRLPLLFLFSNLLVVPLSSLVLLLCLLVCACCWLPILAEPAGALTVALIRLMNGHVLGMDAVPHASLTELRPAIPQVIVLYMMIATLGLLRNSIRKKVLGMLALLIMGYRLLGFMEDVRHDRQQALIVFNSRHQRLYALVEGRDMLVFADAATGTDTLARDRYLGQAVVCYHSRTPVMVHLIPGKNMTWTTAGRSWSIVCGQGWTRFTEKKGGRSCTVLSSSFDGVPERPMLVGPEAVVVADASAPLWKITQWKSTFEGVPSRFHSVPEQGAFVAELASSLQPAP